MSKQSWLLRRHNFGPPEASVGCVGKDNSSNPAFQGSDGRRISVLLPSCCIPTHLLHITPGSFLIQGAEPIPLLDHSRCAAFGAYNFFAASRAVKNTQPPTAIQITLGSHPCRGPKCEGEAQFRVARVTLSHEKNSIAGEAPDRKACKLQGCDCQFILLHDLCMWT